MRGLGAALVVAVGVVLTGFGAGVGLPHLVDAGLSATTVLGLAGLVAGLVLLVAGGRTLVAAAPGWWRAPATVALVLVVLPLTWSLGIAFAVTNVPPSPLDERRPSDVGLPSADVAFETDDGVTLAAWYVPSRNGAAVALLHGAGSNRTHVLDQAAVLAADGYGVLLVDARGHGESGGRAMDFGWYGDQDTGAAVTWLTEQPDVDAARIGVLGLSMGGEEAIGAVGADRRIRAVVAEGATGRTAADKAWLDDHYGWRGWLQRQLDRVTYAAVDVLSGAERPGTLRDAAAAAERPILLITAGDVEDEGRAARWIQQAAPATVQVWDVPGAGHTDGLDVDPQGWARRVTAFLDHALVADP